jgi:DNA-binding transcriptional LysR family regulator
MNHDGYRLDGYKLEWLTSFLAVVDFGGFAAAAENSFRSQPRISTHVADLEKHLGAVLFDRRERPVRLTDAGIAFLEHARRVLNSLDSGVSSVQAVLGLLRGGVRLGWHPSAGAAFRPMLPAPRESGLQHHPLWEEPLVAVVPEGHDLAEREYVSVVDLAAHPVITIGPSGAEADSMHEIHRAFMQASVTPTIAYRTNIPQTLVSLAREGLGVGVTNLLAAAVSDTSGVRVIPLKESGNRRQVAVFWNTARPLQPASRALIDLVVQLPVPAAVQQHQRRA